MWLGLFVEMGALLIMLLFVILSRPVSGIFVGIFVVGMLVCIISSLLVQRESTKENYSKKNTICFKKNILRYIMLLIPIIVMLVITHLLG